MELLVAYTNPSLRNKIKSQVMASSQGGKPGQWSARKAQLVAQKYEKAGGGYSGAKTKAQSNLSKWTKEKWKPQMANQHNEQVAQHGTCQRKHGTIFQQPKRLQPTEKR
jgi:hypothetical protein